MIDELSSKKETLISEIRSQRNLQNLPRTKSARRYKYAEKVEDRNGYLNSRGSSG